MPMMVITTKSSTSVNARRARLVVFEKPRRTPAMSARLTVSIAKSPL
jgi:hypothetical protein